MNDDGLPSGVAESPAAGFMSEIRWMCLVMVLRVGEFLSRNFHFYAHIENHTPPIFKKKGPLSLAICRDFSS